MLEKMTPPVLQRVIQSTFLVLCLHTGWQFHRFVLWATGASEVFVPRPASVEAFLPIAALMGLRRLLQTGVWDMVHPAALAILLAAMVTALVLRKGFCGYVCPVGLISGLLNTLGRRLSLSRVPGPWAARLLSVPKYLALGFFVYTVFIGMDLAAIEEFAAGPYNYVADARMLRFFQSPSRTTLVALAALLVLGTVLRSFWCRYLCPYGALLGLFSFFSPLKIRRDTHTCVDCGKCAQACPSRLPVDRKAAISSPECTGCLSCEAACPTRSLAMAPPGGRDLLAGWRFPLLVVALFALGVGTGMISGLWESSLTADDYRRLIPMSRHLIH